MFNPLCKLSYKTRQTFMLRSTPRSGAESTFTFIHRSAVRRPCSVAHIFRSESASSSVQQCLKNVPECSRNVLTILNISRKELSIICVVSVKNRINKKNLNLRGLRTFVFTFETCFIVIDQSSKFDSQFLTGKRMQILSQNKALHWIINDVLEDRYSFCRYLDSRYPCCQIHIILAEGYLFVKKDIYLPKHH